jgi:hypothetical protein
MRVDRESGDATEVFYSREPRVRQQRTLPVGLLVTPNLRKASSISIPKSLRLQLILFRPGTQEFNPEQPGQLRPPVLWLPSR